MKSIEELKTFGENQLRQLNTHFESGNYVLAINYAREVLGVCCVMREYEKSLQGDLSWMEQKLTNDR